MITASVQTSTVDGTGGALCNSAVTTYVPTTAATPARPWRAVTEVREPGRCSRKSAIETVATPTRSGNQIGLLHTNGTASVKYSVVPVTTWLWSRSATPPHP